MFDFMKPLFLQPWILL